MSGLAGVAGAAAGLYGLEQLAHLEQQIQALAQAVNNLSSVIDRLRSSQEAAKPPSATEVILQPPPWAVQSSYGTSVAPATPSTSTGVNLESTVPDLAALTVPTDYSLLLRFMVISGRGRIVKVQPIQKTVQVPAHGSIVLSLAVAQDYSGSVGIVLDLTGYWDPHLSEATVSLLLDEQVQWQVPCGRDYHYPRELYPEIQESLAMSWQNPSNYGFSAQVEGVVLWVDATMWSTLRQLLQRQMDLIMNIRSYIDRILREGKVH